MRSKSGKKQIGKTVHSGYRSSSKGKYSMRAVYSARDTASFVVSHISQVSNFTSSYVNMWSEFVKSDAFKSVYRMFEQVAVNGVALSIAITNVIPTNTFDTRANGSVQFIHGWDRDGVFRSDGNYGSKNDQEKLFNEVSRMSSCKTDNVGISTATRVIYTKVYSESLQEKGVYLSTDLLTDSFQNERFDNILTAKLSNWNPSLFMVLQPGYQAQLTVTYKFYLVCRGVRVKRLPSDNNNNNNIQLPVNVGDYSTLVMKVIKGYALPDSHVDIDKSRPVDVKYILPSPSMYYDHMRAIREKYNNINQNRVSLKVLTVTDVLNADINSTDILFTSSWKYDNDRQMEVTKYYLFNCIPDADWKKDITQHPIADSVAQYVGTKGQQVYNYHNTGNAWFSEVKPEQYGIRPYTDEASQLERLALRVDGSKCYSQEKGGIYAEGYVDLNGPNPVDNDDDNHASGENAVGIAFTRIGDTVANSSQEANQALLEYNIQNTGPQFEEQYTHEKLVLFDTQKNYGHISGAYLTPVETYQGSEDYEQSQISGLTHGGDGVINFMDQLKMKIQINLNIYAGQNSDSPIQLTYANNVSDPDYLMTVDIKGAYSQSSTGTPILQITGHMEDPELFIPRYLQSFQVVNENARQISEAQLFMLLWVIQNLQIDFVLQWKSSTDISYNTLTRWIIPLAQFIPFREPEQASKFWQRIKGFFTSAWKAIKNIVPKVAKVVSPILPPPYGTVVAGIGTGVSVVDNAINAIATSAVKQSNTLQGMVTVSDSDAFEVTPQFRIVPYDSTMSNIVDVTTSSDDQWNGGQTYSIKVNSTVQNTFNSSQNIRDYPRLFNDIQIYKQALHQSGTILDTPELSLQQRAKVTFFKQCTQEQAANYMTTLRLGVSQSVSEGQDEVVSDNLNDLITQVQSQQ